jgi:predicted TIM-barrel fold metal-dependent hydrolase
MIDAHLHLFRNGYAGFAATSPLGAVSDVDAYEALRGKHGISAGLVVCYEAGGLDPGNNAYVRDLALTRPWIHSVAYLDPRPRLPTDRIDKLLSAGHAGIALYLPDGASAEAVLAWPAEAWARLDRARAIVSLNARPEAIAGLQPLVERASGCSFLFSHLGLPGRHEAAPSTAEAAARLAPLLRLARSPNVGVKISGLYAIDPLPPHPAARPFLDLLVENFASSNLHWGSDFSPALEFVSFGDTLAIPALDALATADRSLIFGDALAAKLDRVMR